MEERARVAVSEILEESDGAAYPVQGRRYISLTLMQVFCISTIMQLKSESASFIILTKQ